MKNPTIIICVLAAALIFLCPLPRLHAGGDETIRVEVTEVPYRPVHAFLKLCFEFAGKQPIEDKNHPVSQSESILGFSLGLISARPGDIQFESSLGYRRLKADKIGYGLGNITDLSVHLGGRYYPRYPTFGLGKTPIRLTFSALGGADWLTAGDWSDVIAFSVVLSGGLSISSGDNPSGLLVEFVYRPVGTDMKLKTIDGILAGTLLLKPAWCIRIAWLFGP